MQLPLEINAQNINDVVRFGLEDIQGTARFQALSGAFGALGGDLSALKCKSGRIRNFQQ